MSGKSVPKLDLVVVTIADAIDVLVGDAREGVVDYGLPGDVAEDLIESGGGELGVAAKGWVSREKFGRTGVEGCIKDIAFEAVEAGAKVAETVAPKGAFLAAHGFVKAFNAG